MWIRAVYCAEDTVYAERLASFLDKEYGDKIELSICSSMELMFDHISKSHIDIVLFDNGFEKEVLNRSKDISCTCAFMTEQVYETKEHELVQIDKFQRGNMIYKNILDLYSNGKDVKRINTHINENINQKTYVFVSASGGSGTSTVAKAYAKKCATYEKVLYLDLGLFNMTKVIEGDPNGMDEVILALKSRRNILPLKLTSAVSNTADRFFTYGSCSNELNLLELNEEDVRNLLNGISALSEYQKIIIDVGASISLKEIELMKNSDVIICVIDESDIGREKYEKFRTFLKNVGQKEQMQLIKKLLVFRNKIRQDYDITSLRMGNRTAGWAPYVSMNSYDEVVDRIAYSDSFSNLEIKNAE